MSNAMIFSENYLDPATLAANVYSSQKTDFPASNAYDFQRRGKVWRSNGYFEITAANKGIVLQEVDGVNQTVNIAEGTYASDTLFFAALKTALDSAAGTAVYTITRNVTTNKIVITSNGAGGAILKLMGANVAFTAADTLGFSAADKTGSLTYTADLLRIHTSEFLSWDFGASVDPEGFFAIGPRNSALKVSPTATVTLMGNETDVWTAPSYSEVIPYTDYVLGLVRAGGLHTDPLRYWRLKIVDRDNTYGYIELGIAFLGPSTTMTSGAIKFPLSKTFVDPSTKQMSSSGHSTIVKQDKTALLRFDWWGLTKEEKELIDDIWQEVGFSSPVFFHLDPDAVYSSNAFKNLYYARFETEPESSLISPGLFTCDMNIREEI